MGTIYATALAIVATATGLLALAEAIAGSVEPGVVADDSGGSVRSVAPGGFAWRNGIRVGQTVVSLGAADQPAGWRIVTTDGAVERRSSLAVATGTLRSSWPFGVAAAVLGGLALVALPTRRRRAELAASLGLVLAAFPMWLGDDPYLSAPVLLAALAAPAIWLVRWAGLSGAARASLVAAAPIVVAGWVATKWTADSLFDLFELLRIAGTVGLASACVAVGTGLTSVRDLRALDTLRVLDLAVFAVIVALVGVLHFVMLAPPLLTVVAGLIPAIIYPRVRAGAGRALDYLLFAEMRERATLDAAERERARLARDLHDDPLQALAGVIRGLESRPDTLSEQDALRSVAEHLRGMATELRPPVLDDLGLVPAIEHLLSAPTDGVQKRAEVVNEAGYGASGRPPAPVELAIFRMVQEAVTNALKHSSCHELVVRGRVSAGAVTIEVIDDGDGIPDQGLERALRAGRLGVSSMRRRAEAIDARLVHRSAPGEGTTVRIEWQM